MEHKPGNDPLIPNLVKALTPLAIICARRNDSPPRSPNGLLARLKNLS